MSTTSEKLSFLLNAKADMKAALAEKGMEVGDVFSTYPDKIRAIPSEIVASDDGNGNVTLAIAGATISYNDGNVIIS